MVAAGDAARRGGSRCWLTARRLLTVGLGATAADAQCTPKSTSAWELLGVTVTNTSGDTVVYLGTIGLATNYSGTPNITCVGGSFTNNDFDGLSYPSSLCSSMSSVATVSSCTSCTGPAESNCLSGACASSFYTYQPSTQTCIPNTCTAPGSSPPTGYTIANTAGTTIAALGSVSCASSYSFVGTSGTVTSASTIHASRMFVIDPPSGVGLAAWSVNDTVLVYGSGCTFIASVSGNTANAQTLYTVESVNATHLVVSASSSGSAVGYAGTADATSGCTLSAPSTVACNGVPPSTSTAFIFLNCAENTCSALGMASLDVPCRRFSITHICMPRVDGPLSPLLKCVSKILWFADLVWTRSPAYYRCRARRVQRGQYVGDYTLCAWERQLCQRAYGDVWRSISVICNHA